MKAAEKEAKMRRTQRRKLIQVARRRQRDVLCDVMLSARQCGTWLTLDELAKLTHYPPASISAQLRHLRKAEYGAWVVEKRRREWVMEEVVWEYRLAEGGVDRGKGSKGGKGEEIGGGDERKAGDGV